jgi:hypothetical protein
MYLDARPSYLRGESEAGAPPNFMGNLQFAARSAASISRYSLLLIIRSIVNTSSCASKLR